MHSRDMISRPSRPVGAQIGRSYRQGTENDETAEVVVPTVRPAASRGVKAEEGRRAEERGGFAGTSDGITGLQVAVVGAIATLAKLLSTN